MKRRFFLLILFMILVSNGISASNERIGIGFSFDLSFLSKPHFILSLEGDLGDDFVYQISKDFLDEKDAKLMVGKYRGEEYATRSTFYVGIKYKELSNHECFLRLELNEQELLSEKLFSFSNEEYIDKLILEYYIPSNDGRFRIEKIYWPKDKDYFIKYLLFNWRFKNKK